VKIIIAGSSGFVGSALVPQLRMEGHEILRLVRRATRASDEIAWDPSHRTMSETAFEGADAVINLAGENVAGGRWTAVRRRRIAESRFDSTQTMVNAFRARKKPPPVFLSASAIGFYGDRGDEFLTEASAAGRGFLAGVCAEWERRAAEAEEGGVRVVSLRFGVVLGREGGALARMLPIFRRGLGGRLGSGEQFMSWVTLSDTVRAIRHALITTSLRGALNVTAPVPVTNQEFTDQLAAALGKPARLPVPAFVLRAAFGQMAVETILASTRVLPSRLRESGFEFEHAKIAVAMQALFSRALTRDGMRGAPQV
jgi:hypothetical protein